MLRVLFSIPSLAALVAALVLGVLIWLFAPLLGDAFDGVLLRAPLAALPFLLWLVIAFFAARRSAGRDAALVAAVAAPDPAAEAAGRSAEEEAELRQKLTGAMAALKQATGGKGGFLYELPWYVIIGPPGSGKTTALANSGLEFPLAEGGGKLAGVGGTRFCEWWISERAVLLDTAGRYTTQDSDAAVDKAGWERFLNLLKTNRPKQPLNGILVAFGVDMIARLDAASREQHARAVRRRIKELETHLGQRLPVYFLVSKADLMPGFTEFFDDLDKAGREQVWGVTFPAEVPAEGTPKLWPAEFQALLDRLEARIFERLQTERGPQQRALIAGLPAQWASLAEPLGAFLTAAFGGSRMDAAPFLRGVYFTSGTQEGTPLDRLSGALSRAFGLDPRRPAAAMGQKGRAYFLGRLLKDVVFNEARLASGDVAKAKRARLVQFAAWGGALLLILGGAAFGYTALQAEQRRAALLAEAITRAEAAPAGVDLARVTDADVSRVLTYLQSTQALPDAARGDGSLGLSQEERLSTESRFAYRRALERSFLPRLLSRLETQIRSGMQRPDFLYETTRVYLMLGRQGPLDKALVKEWFALDWNSAFPGAVNQAGRDALSKHLDALLALDFPAYPLDGAMVDEARRVFSRLPLAERVYTRWRAMGADIAPWRPSDALGIAGQRWFVRASGKPLTEGVPGVFTVEGFHRTLLPRLPQAVLEGSSEAWVLGAEAARGGAGDARRLENDVLALYAEEYVRTWQGLLDDIVLPPFANLNAAAEGLNLLGAPNSPIRDLIRGVVRQVSLGTAPDAAAQGAVGQAAADAAAARVGGTVSRLAAAVGQSAGPSATERVANVVEGRFAALKTASGAPMDEILRTVNALYVQVQRLASSPPGTVLPPSPGGLDPGQALLAEASRQPEPLAKWLRTLGNSTQQARAGGVKSAISAAFRQQFGAVCSGLETRFPFRRTAAAPEMPIDDFVRLFAPSGSMDQFFAGQVRPYADTTQNPWQPVAADGLAPPVSAADLLQFQRAARIRDAFFPSGVPGLGLGVRFQITPQGLPAGSLGGVFDNEGNRIAITPGGGGRPIELSWPTRNPIQIFNDVQGTPPPAFSYEGPWASLKFVFTNRLVATPQPDRFRLGTPGGDFLLQAASATNPFGLRELMDFRCPALPPQ